MERQPVIQRVRARAFKSLVHVDVALSPLTVMVGANSSGKSSLVQTVLLLAQAQRQTPAEATVALNGRLVELGDLADLRSHAVGEHPVTLGAVFSLRNAPEDASQAATIDWLIRLRSASESLHGAARVCGVDVRMEDDSQTVELQLVEDAGALAEKRALYSRARSIGLAGGPQQLVSFEGQLCRVPATGDGERAQIRGARLRGAFPAGLLVEEDELTALLARAFEEAARRRSRTALAQMKRGLAPAGRPSSAPERCGDQLPDREPADIAAAARWIEEMRGMPGGGDLSGADALLGRLSPEALPRLLEELQRRGIDSHRVLVPAEGEEIELLRGASTAITAYLERHVWYLGANRHRGSQLSQIAVSGSPTDIGVSGEHVASVLRAYSQREVKNCPPAPGAEAPPGTLEAAVNYWARHLGVIAEYDVLDYGPGSELRVTTYQAGEKVDLSHVGAGVGALLPVVVLCLLAEPGAVILLEEPELHLHPAVQQRLADFFLACAESGRQLVVETHSDVLITRLRRRVAEDETGERLRLVSILFAELRDGATSFESVPLNKYGGIDEWPHGFFDEQADDAESILAVGGARLAADLERAEP